MGSLSRPQEIQYLEDGIMQKTWRRGQIVMKELREAVCTGNIYVYKLTTDNGGAPCVHEGLLSLAICKPHIRTNARMGDWIIGFGGKSVDELKYKLIYIAKVTAIEEQGHYYRKDQYVDRPDCVYQPAGNGFQYRDGKKYHSAEHLTHDLGQAPTFERAVTLLSDQFAYFGGAAERPSLTPPIKDLYEGLPRDYRKNHDSDLRECLEDFIVSVFAFRKGDVSASPTHRNKDMKCSKIEDGVETFSRRC